MSIKAAAGKKTTTTAGSDNIQQSIDTFAAKQQFISSTLSMSWQLALTVVVPVIAGVKLDEKFNTSPSLTLTGFFLAATAACVVVWRVVKDVTKQQAEEDKEKESSAN
jgi:F0F1-type ATP synthase assembly protein I